jgi:hypothetical protein
MAISTKTIQDTINWAKRLTFNRNPVIGNSLEPALTSAQMVMQTILGPPFEWWWNNEELVFTCNPVPNSATSTVVSVAGGVVTVTAPNTFNVGDLVLPKSLVTLTALNGFLLEVATRSATQFTALVPGITNGSDTAGVFTNITTQDYPVATPEFSHIEHANVLDLDSTGKPTKWYELTIKNQLSLETSSGRPEFLSPHSEDGQGNTMFRVTCAPDKKYPVSIRIQKAAPAVTSINQTWAPIPDFMQYVTNWGFLALMQQFLDDPSRATYANNKFTAALLARADGLSDEQKNIFLNNWDEMRMGFGPTKQQGINARGQ